MTTIEQPNNALRMLRSLTSGTCPICSRRKIERTAICVPCAERLPAAAVERLHAAKFGTPDYGPALADVFKAAGAFTFYEPDPAHPCQRFSTSLENFSARRLSVSFASMVCPACSAHKAPGLRFCKACDKLTDFIVGDDNQAQVNASMARVAAGYPAATQDPAAAAVAMQKLMALLGADVFFIPVE